jgi:ferrous iron transport protein A
MVTDRAGPAVASRLLRITARAVRAAAGWRSPSGPRQPARETEIQMLTFTLDRLPINQCGRVAGVAGPANLRRRLLEMGLTPGASVRVVRFAPLGDPIDVEIRGYHLSLRKSEASQVTLTRL